MSAFTNVLEEIVFRELQLQIEELRPELQEQINISEVVAYTLNRLPPLFATSIVGYKRQHDYALNELNSRAGFQNETLKGSEIKSASTSFIIYKKSIIS